MKESIFMRDLFCKIHWPFMCFSKPSAANLYTWRPWKRENTPHVACAVDDVSVDASCEGGGNRKCDAESPLKSCIRSVPRPPVSDNTKEVHKKRVQWMDEFGKELAQIKEYEPRCIA